MLHALLRNKLTESIPEPQRIEDALTSTVFGTLVLVGAWHLLERWLGLNSDASQPEDAESRNDCWFWPRLAFAVPDVVLRLGKALVVVEAKYASGRHDTAAANVADEDLSDQLVRQYRSVTTSVDSRPRYLEPIEQAIVHCSLVQVYVVDARRMRRAQRDFDESEGRLPAGACVRLVTWQSLFRLLDDASVQRARWVADLRAYLDLSGLDTFCGIGRRLVHGRGVESLSQWRARRQSSDFTGAVSAIVHCGSVAALRLWRLPVQSSRAFCSDLVPERVIDGVTRRAILTWRIPAHKALMADARHRQQRDQR